MQNLLAYPYFWPSYTSLNIFFKKSPKNGRFGKYAPSLTKCHFFCFWFFCAETWKAAANQCKFSFCKTKIDKRIIFDEIMNFCTAKCELRGFRSGLMFTFFITTFPFKQIVTADSHQSSHSRPRLTLLHYRWAGRASRGSGPRARRTLRWGHSIF